MSLLICNIKMVKIKCTNVHINHQNYYSKVMSVISNIINTTYNSELIYDITVLRKF